MPQLFIKVCLVSDIHKYWCRNNILCSGHPVTQLILSNDLLATLQRDWPNILAPWRPEDQQNVSRLWISGESPPFNIHTSTAPSRMRASCCGQKPDLCVDPAPGEILSRPHAGEGGGHQGEGRLWQSCSARLWCRSSYSVDFLPHQVVFFGARNFF